MNVNANLMRFCDQTDDFKIIDNSSYVNMASAILLLVIKISNNTLTTVIVIIIFMSIIILV